MKLSVDAQGRTAVIPLPGAARLPPTLEHGGESFVRKGELHVTLVGSRPGLDGTMLAAAARDLDFRVRPLGAHRLVRSGERRALIELVEVDGRDAYYERLERALGRAVPRMPPHVTLFTEPGGRGIALYGADELARLSEPAALSPAPSPWRLDGDGAILGA